MTNRRGFFKTLFAGTLAARTVDSTALYNFICSHTQKIVNLAPISEWPAPFDYAANLERANRHMLQMVSEWEKDAVFFTGCQWKPRLISPTSAHSSPAPDSLLPLS